MEREVVRQIYDHTNEQLAVAWVDEIVRNFADTEMPLEVRQMGRTIAKWRHQIVAWHRAHVSNGPTEAVIILSGCLGVVDVADTAVEVRRGRVLWSASLRSPMLRAA